MKFHGVTWRGKFGEGEEVRGEEISKRAKKDLTLLARKIRKSRAIARKKC